ncbi:MAG: S1 RNA-binding domain-containing protein, partial [Spirochaetales bacterium]|nr:S1 RNA-binding domain-containing protein [Spirochaetales bacterium]
GVFIELEEGIEGLAHISELSWVKRISHPREVVSIGATVSSKILGYDTGEKKISLGMKQVTNNPWDTIVERFPEGKRLNAEVVKITNAGAFLNLEEGIDGFLHIDDISWTKKTKNIKSFCSEGDTIEVVITKVESGNRRIRLGVKQLEGNPWQTLKESYPKGSVITGEITSITDFGVFVKVIAGIEGLISKFNLVGPDEEFDDSVLGKFKSGDKVTALVTDININAQRLSLSIKDYLRKSQQSEMSKYIHNDENENEHTFTFADLLKEKDQGAE